jgi:uncharacterized protein YdiU (UPF0061 family)
MMEKDHKITAGWNLDNSYARLPKEMYSKLSPTPVTAPKLVLCNLTLAQELGLNQEGLTSPEGVLELSGNKIPDGAEPLAQAYAGHQFGHFTMLGDGRAILLGEQLTQDGKRFDIQLKGSGRTPYSRGGDGRAALGPMLREYIISEAMYGLGIPTTRSLAVVATGEMVYRDTTLPGAVLTRVAASHIRVGTFQYAAASEKPELLKAMVDFTLSRHYPGFEEAPNKALYLLQEVVKRQASLIAKWQLVGFIHGVMNTDNMALSGESIDFGPCAFMDAYDEDTVFSSIDRNGRYAYGNQPKMAAWNLARFAETLLTLIHVEPSKAVEIAQNEVTRFHELYHENWLAGMRAKLGLNNQEDSDEGLIQELLSLMKKYKADYTNTFRSLTLGQIQGMEMFESKEFTAWYEQWQTRLKQQPESCANSQQLMKTSNPSIIPRNHRVEEALTAAVEQNDMEKFNRLLNAVKEPFAYSKDQEEFVKIPEIPQQKYQTFCGT